MTDRTMRVLEHLAAEPSGVRVSDLAKLLGLNKSIPYRILTDLAALGYVWQDPMSERYHATFSLGSLGLRQIEASGVDDWAQDELDSLAAKTRELVRLAVVSGERLRWICLAQGADSALIIDANAGSDVAPHATASGKAWLSTLDDLTVERLLNERGLASHTTKTISSLSALVRELDETRRTGYAAVFEEMEPGVSAIAAPVVPPESTDGIAVATVSIAGPTSRIQDVMVDFAPELLKTAQRLAGRWHAYVYLNSASGRRGVSVEPAGD